MNTLFALGLMITSACGYSPILNHTSPVRATSDAASGEKTSLNCRYYFKLQNLCADFVWEKEPKNSDDEGAMKIYFWSPDRPSVFVNPGVAFVGVKLWMTTMGHGSGKVAVKQAVDSSGIKMPGVFDATQINFVMGGEWDIFIQLKDAAGVVVASEKVSYSAN